MKLGIYPNLPIHEYAQIDAANQSILKRFARSAAHAREELVRPKESTPAQELGTALHTAILEPQAFEHEYTRGPTGIEADRRRKVGKEAWKRIEDSHPHALVLKAEDYDFCRQIQEKAWLHPTVGAMLRARGRREVTVLWEDPETDVLCKARLDLWCRYAGATWIVELKTTSGIALPSGFAREMHRYRYDCQAAMYLDGLDALEPAHRRFAYLAIEKEPPFEMKLLEPGLATLEKGRTDLRRWLQLWKRAKQTGQWPGYDPGIETVELPKWAFTWNEEDW